MTGTKGAVEMNISYTTIAIHIYWSKKKKKKKKKEKRIKRKEKKT